jgi:hypothetical protein
MFRANLIAMMRAFHFGSPPFRGKSPDSGDSPDLLQKKFKDSTAMIERFFAPFPMES